MNNLPILAAAAKAVGFACSISAAVVLLLNIFKSEWLEAYRIDWCYNELLFSFMCPNYFVDRLREHREEIDIYFL